MARTRACRLAAFALLAAAPTAQETWTRRPILDHRRSHAMAFGTARLLFAIPNDPTLVRASFFNQVVVQDPAANPGGAAVSNGAAAVIGWR